MRTLFIGVAFAWVILSIAVPAWGQITYEDRVMEIVNEERWNNGQLPPLKRNVLLDDAAETHSVNMSDRDFFAHCDLDNGSLPWDRMVDAGYVYNAAGENIAAGYGTPEDVMTGWMNSSGHRANILSTGFRELGVGFYQAGSDQGNVRRDQNGDCGSDGTGGPYYRYWTQNFGRYNTVYPVVIERERYETDSRNVALYLYGEGWATEMRIRNLGEAWTEWTPFASNVDWTLAPGNGVRVVEVEIRSGVTVRSAFDTIELTGQEATAVGDPPTIASGILLRAPNPNPFRGSTVVAYELAQPGEVHLAVYDIRGRRVALLESGSRDAGEYEVRWDGRGDSGAEARPGIYFLQLVAGGETRSVKVMRAS
jgi:uncharacterized protein YkwD